ncbi:MAG: InlB B-repeat-containing protein, partial [Lachnospiraceae bacterium]|nr:InlB B-repeat-containing protein [Lachnospiraceae bacterium]
MKSSVTSRKQRFWALLLAVVMVVGLLPMAEVSAANYDLDDTNYTTALSGVKRLEAGETICNTNGNGGKSIKVIYCDIDGRTEIYDETRVAGLDTEDGTIKILTYNEAVSYAQGYNPQLSSGITNWWKPSVGLNSSGDGIEIKLVPLRAYTLNWDLNGGSVKLKNGSALPTSFIEGDPEISLALNDFDATKPAHTFAGWVVGTNPVGQTGNSNSIQSIKDDTLATLDRMDAAQNPTTVTDYSITFTAQWTAGDPVVTYLYNTKIKDLETVAYQTVTLNPGTAPTRPANDPVVEGATFGGWYADPACTKEFDFSATLNSGDAVTAYAKWTINKYDITFDNNIPESKDTPTITGVGRFGTNSSGYYNITVTLPPAPVKNDANNSSYDNYTFDGWSVKVSPAPSTTPYPAGSTVKVDDLLNDLGADKSPIPMIANWTGLEYYIHYNLAPGGMPAPTSGVAVPTQSPKKEYGKDSFDIETVSDTTDYIFKGWSYDANSGSTIDLTSGTETVKNVRDAYEKATGITVYGSGNIEVYGVWNPLHTVTYYGNGDNANSVIPGYVEHGDNFTLSKNTSEAKPYYEKTGYHMIGWCTKADGSADVLALGADVSPILGNKDFYAQWEQNTYTVAFDANTTDAVTGTMAPCGFTYGAAALALPSNEFVRTGYTFTGWATTPTGAVAYTDGQEVKDLTDVDNGTVTLYAVWQKNTYTITWNDGDGNPIGTTTVAHGDTPAYTLAATPTKKATASATYTFNNTWSPALAAATGDVTYTAQFNESAVTYVITWKDGDGKTLGTTNVAYGTVPSYNLNVTPTKTATASTKYTFNNSWSPALTAVTGDVTYTAQFNESAVTYVITWKDGDGKTLGTTNVAYGTVPSYNLNVTPTKTATASTKYTFNNSWSPA